MLAVGAASDSISQINDCEEIKRGERQTDCALGEGGSRSLEISRNIKCVWVYSCECVSKEKRQRRGSS